jgi:NAD(P)H-hydrate epimerase
VPARQLDILQRMHVPITPPNSVPDGEINDLITDGMIGYSLSGAPKEAAADLIRWADAQRAPILALDVPSGLDATTGTVFTPCIRASATMTLALPKEGLRAPNAARYVGELYVADISVPPALYGGPVIGMIVGPLFAECDVIRLW